MAGACRVAIWVTVPPYVATAVGAHPPSTNSRRGSAFRRRGARGAHLLRNLVAAGWTKARAMQPCVRESRQAARRSRLGLRDRKMKFVSLIPSQLHSSQLAHSSAGDFSDCGNTFADPGTYLS